MNETMEMKLEEIYESLSDEQKMAVEACRSIDELVEFAGKEGIELPEEMVAYLRKMDSELSIDDLEDVAGGRAKSRSFSAYSALRMLSIRRKEAQV